MILAVDPGDTTGLAFWSEDYDFIGSRQVPLEEVPANWDDLQAQYGKITLAIVEDFVLFGKRAQSQTGSRMKASQGIGMIKALAAIQDTEVVIQPSKHKDIALKWSGIKLPSQHKDTHEYDAYLHGYYWLVSNKKIKTQLEIERGL